MTILVTGANGQLGNEMRIISRGSADRFVFTDVCDASEESLRTLACLGGADVDTSTVHLDITDLQAVREAVARYGVDVIVNCAAYTNVDAAEDNEPLAELLNATAPAHLAAAMREVGGLLVHVSTDYVFGGDPYNTPCREDQTGTPTGVYGLTKLHGEQAIISSGCRYVILRTAWLYSEFGRNFVRTMLSLTSTKPLLKVVFDQAGTPTFARDLAGAILRVAGSGADLNSGIYHYSNEGVCSWFDFTRMIYAEGRRAGIVPTGAVCDIQPCHSDEFPSKVHRPAYSVLDKTLFKTTFGMTVPYWTDSLRDCIDNIAAVAGNC